MDEKEPKIILEGETSEIENQDVNPIPDTREDTDEVLNAEQEAEKRGITVEQWMGVLHIIESDVTEEVNHNTFEYDGNGNIMVNGDLTLCDSGVERLPKNLKVKEGLYVNGSEALLELPLGLEAGIIDLTFCDAMNEIREVPYIFERIQAGKIKAVIIASWNAYQMKNILPDGLKYIEGANVIYMDDSVLSDGYIEYKIEEAEMIGEMEEDE